MLAFELVLQRKVSSASWIELGGEANQHLRVRGSADPLTATIVRGKSICRNRPVELAGGCQGLHFALHVSYPALVGDKFEAVCFAEIPGWFRSSLFTRIK